MSNTINSRLVSILEEMSMEDLHCIAQECNGYNGSCEDLCWYDFDDDFFDTFFYNNPMEAARATHFGNINWRDGYIRFNAYGNLVSTYSLDYSRWEIEEIADSIMDLHNNITLPTEIEALFEEDREGEEVPLF